MVTNGGRIELRLSPASGETAEYEAELTTRLGCFRGRARLQVAEQRVDFDAWSSDGPGEPPDWLVGDARAALKAALRTRQSEGRWPRRITRWRPEPAA